MRLGEYCKETQDPPFRRHVKKHNCCEEERDLNRPFLRDFDYPLYFYERLRLNTLPSCPFELIILACRSRGVS